MTEKKNIDNKNKLHSEKLQRIMDCLDGEHTAEEVLLQMIKNGIILQRPKKDVIESLNLLRIIGAVEIESNGKRRIFRKSKTEESAGVDLCVLSETTEIILEGLKSSKGSFDARCIKSKLKDVSEMEIEKVIRFLAKKGHIKINDKKISRNEVVYTYK